jgi:transposase, IS5 family
MLKKNQQLTFGMQEDTLMRKKETMLDELETLIDFRPIDKLLNKQYDRKMGRPAIPPLMLFKMLLLEQWYGLSDVKVVEEVHDRRSFERFIGQEVRQYHVDDTTLVKFRERIRDGKIEKQLFDLINEQLDRRGMFIRKGTIIDSTIVQGATRTESRRKDGELVDPDVAYTSRKGQVKEGMKVHLSMDRESGLIERIDLTSIRVHDHQVFRELIPDETRIVYADKAYDSEEHRLYLKQQNKRSGILRRGCRYRPLTVREKRRNAMLSRIRSAIEPKINDLKRWCHLQRLRYFTCGRNLIQVMCVAIGANLKRSVRLAKM